MTNTIKKIATVAMSFTLLGIGQAITQNIESQTSNFIVASAAFNPYNGTVKTQGSNLNVRSGPGTNYRRVRALSNGSKVTIYEENNGWGRISGSQEWVSLAYISKNVSGTRVLYVAGSGVNIRKGPGTSYSSAGKKSNGDKIFVTNEKDGWLQMTDGNWISKDFTFEYPSDITQAEFILLCNCVGAEVGSDSQKLPEKATVVEVVMNRVNDNGTFKNYNTIKSVVGQHSGNAWQFSGAKNYIDKSNYSSQVTKNVIKGVLEYFNNKSSYNHGYLYMCAYNGHNYFSTKHPEKGGASVTYTCPGVGTHKFKADNSGRQIPE